MDAVGCQSAGDRRQVGVSGYQRHCLQRHADGPGPGLERQHDVGSLFRPVAEIGIVPDHPGLVQDAIEAA
jgi:hypothetical protein